MTKQEFLRRLNKSISGLPESDRQELLADYEEHFRSGTEEGRTEEEICAALGNPGQIGASAEMESFLDSGPGSRKGTKIVRALFASTSLGLFNAIFVIGPYAGLVGAIAGLWAGAVSLALSGVGAVVLLLIAPLFPSVSTAGLSPLFVVFAGIGCSALGVLATFGMWKLSKLFVEMTRRYVLFNVRIAKGEKR